MRTLVDPLLVTVLLLNLMVLGTSRLRAAIMASALQGFVLGALAIVAHEPLGWRSLLVGVGAAGIKGLLIPAMLLRAMRDLPIRREIEPYIGFGTSILAGAVATGGSLVYASTLPLAPQHTHSLLVPAALATVLSGFLVLITRKKAITQVVGYVVMENGIFVMGLTLIEAMPFMIEVGALLDVFAGIFVMGIIVNHINRQFSSIDTTRLRSLKE